MQPVPTLAEPEQMPHRGGLSYVHPKRAQGTGSPHLSPHGLLWSLTSSCLKAA